MATILRGLVPPERAAAMARALRDAGDGAWHDGRTTAAGPAAAVKRNRQLDPDGEVARQLAATVLDALDRSAAFFSAALPKRVLPPMFNRHAAGALDRYGPHVDQAVRLLGAGADGGGGGGGIRRLRADLACTLFLSAPGDCDGGELVVAHGAGESSWKLAPGDAVLYDAGAVHRVAPVVRGERLACVFWVESLVRDPTQRTLLHAMDLALVALRARDGESDESLALIGCWHNLLRMWSDVA